MNALNDYRPPVRKITMRTFKNFDAYHKLLAMMEVEAGRYEILPEGKNI